MRPEVPVGPRRGSRGLYRPWWIRCDSNGLPAFPRCRRKRSSSTRLETRTEESNGCASKRAVNPSAKRKRSVGSPSEGGRHHGPASVGTTESERMRWDPKGGDLSVRAAKPGETPVEARRRY